MESYERILVITAVLPCLLIGQRNEKKVRLGVDSFDGVITSIESFHGQFVRVGTQFVFKPYDYALTVTSLQHHENYLCVQRHLGDGMTTGDQVKVKGNVVQIQNKQTGDLLSLKLDGCKIQSRQSTPNSKSRFLSGTITKKTHDLVPERIAIDFRTDDGQEYQCAQYLMSGLWQTRIDERVAKQRLDVFNFYQIRDKIKVVGFPSLASHAIGACEITEHTQM